MGYLVGSNLFKQSARGLREVDKSMLCNSLKKAWIKLCTGYY